MESLRLTSEQRDKLILLVEHYFPELKDIRYGKKWDSDEIWFLEHENQPIFRDVHWFEFTMRFLLPRMSDDKEPLCYYEEYIWATPGHPVDYAWTIHKDK